jgi:hypothetical protein
VVRGAGDELLEGGGPIVGEGEQFQLIELHVATIPDELCFQPS